MTVAGFDAVPVPPFESANVALTTYVNATPFGSSSGSSNVVAVMPEYVFRSCSVNVLPVDRRTVYDVTAPACGAFQVRRFRCSGVAAPAQFAVPMTQAASLFGGA